EWYGNDSQGSHTTEAREWTVYEGKVLLHPIPSEADSNRYTLYYYRQIAELDSDNDEPEFLDTFHWLCVEWVKWKLYEREAMSAESDRAFAMYAQLLERMRQWYTAP